MSVRDDLMADLRRASWPREGRSATWSEIAGELIAAGWSRPRVVTKTQEIAALAPKTVLRSVRASFAPGAVFVCRDRDVFERAGDATSYSPLGLTPYGPFEVVWSPPAETDESAPQPFGRPAAQLGTPTEQSLDEALGSTEEAYLATFDPDYGAEFIDGPLAGQKHGGPAVVLVYVYRWDALLGYVLADSHPPAETDGAPIGGE